MPHIMPLIIGTPLILAPIILVLYFTSKVEKDRKRPGVLRAPKLFAWFGTMLFIVFGVVAGVAIGMDPQFSGLSFFSWIAVGGVLLVIEYAVWKVELVEDRLIYKTAFRKPRAFSLQDIRLVTITGYSTIVLIKNVKIRISDAIEGSDAFRDKLLGLQEKE